MPFYLGPPVMRKRYVKRSDCPEFAWVCDTMSPDGLNLQVDDQTLKIRDGHEEAKRQDVTLQF